jgi:redox-sensitive bicupin YhaK (pirin superfamily)
MTPRPSALLLAIILLGSSGCFLFHKKSPQQEYTEALMRGNSMQASQVWLNMSPEDRMKFARGEGIQPDQATQKKDIQQMMMKHSENQSGEASGNTAQMEEQVPTPLGASLQQLPGIDSSSPAN